MTSSLEKKLSDVIVEALIEAGAGAFFVFTGGAISHVIDSVAQKKLDSPSYFCFQNEQAAAFAAEAYSRTNPDGKLGVTLTTSGPGASNLLSGIAGAWFDCIPAVYVTGQVRTWELGIKHGRLQGGFQELDIVSMAQTVTKYAKTLSDPAAVRQEILQAVSLSRSGRPGPVLIDIPMDLQFERIQVDPVSQVIDNDEKATEFEGVVDAAIADIELELSRSRRPLVLVGGGVVHSRSQDLVRRFVSEAKIPAVATYAAIDVLGTEATYLGAIGQFGHPRANRATEEADLVLVLGSRLAQKALGNNPGQFAPNARVLSVNVDRDELRASPRLIDIEVEADIRALFMKWKPRRIANEWNFERLFQSHQESVERAGIEVSRHGPISPYHLASLTVSAIGSRRCTLVLDVGQNVVASVQKVSIPLTLRVISSWGNSPMGYSLPASIGAWISDRSRDVVCVIGDGGLQVNIQELQTLVAYGIPVKIILWNNHGYVTIHEYQDGNLDGRYEASDSTHGYSHPDFLRVCEAYGIRTARLRSGFGQDELEAELFGKDGPVVVEVEVDPHARLSPSVKGDNPLYIMSD